jgi:hypothetical protein
MIRFRDDDDPPGDGSGSEDDALEHGARARVDDTYSATCPHCFEENELFVDLGGGSDQSYVEDCAVCCRPWQVRVTVDDEGAVTVELEPLDE